METLPIITEVPTLLLISGPPGSGKSWRAKQWLAEAPDSRVRVNWDELRLQMFGPDWKFNRADEERMKDFSRAIAVDALRAGKSVIVDNTNLSEKVRNSWKNLALSVGASYEEEELNTSIEICKFRDEKREGKARVGWAVIDRMALFNGYIDWDDRLVYPRDFIVVDMDGTIANCDERRKKAFGPTKHKFIGIPETHLSIGSVCPDVDKYTDRQCPTCGGKPRKNWDLFFKDVQNDPPVVPILNLVKLLSQSHDILVVSGRAMDQCATGTEKWLRSYLPNIKHLFMRFSGDRRDDVVVKQEICDLLPKHRISYVLDDRDGVVKMWRQNGLTCLQVAEGAF